MKNTISIVLTTFFLAGCVTLSGTYRVSAINKDGVPISMVMDVQGNHIYSARNAICSAYPGATVSMMDMTTGKELTSESPYKCGNK
ncbi:hypothetical protein EO087_07850 [Dyella sp. M7H15-1]|uniref:hypothetical protein n=1 Tax=Dyella sp. M7H15-1 TaxID=2501295 RepID=UPI0010051830|nr:hypothetical protein [Dyella sp. M7H15-1]QAU23912.1 hypothetical protein EO087_07850 [Dyella sp. M7H15-1]